MKISALLVLVFVFFLFAPCVAFSNANLDCDSYISDPKNPLTISKKVDKFDDLIKLIFKPGFKTTTGRDSDNGEDYQIFWVDVNGESLEGNNAKLKVFFLVSSVDDFIQTMRQLKGNRLPYSEIKNDKIKVEVFCQENERNGFSAEMFSENSESFYMSVDVSIEENLR